MIMARDTIVVKGKQVDTNSNDFGQGPIDMSSLSLIQGLKLATLTQAKASENLLKSHTKDKELISLIGDVLEICFPSLKPDSFDNPSSKLKGMLSVVDSYFESLEKAIDVRVLNKFNAMILETFLKMIEKDRASLITIVKVIQHELDEGGHIYKSCIVLPKFIIDIDKKTK